VTFRSSSAFRSWIAKPRSDQGFFFQPIEGAIKGPDGQRSFRALFDFAADWHAVGVVAQPKNGKQDDLLEFAEMLAAGHMFCIIEQLHGTVKSCPRSISSGERLQVVPGNRYRQPFGEIEVVSAKEVEERSITKRDAELAGYESREELMA